MDDGREQTSSEGWRVAEKKILYFHFYYHILHLLEWTEKTTTHKVLSKYNYLLLMIYEQYNIHSHNQQRKCDRHEIIHCPCSRGQFET